jgi:hypothetical protein
MADPGEALATEIPRMRAAWMAGRSALPACPPEWRAAAGEGVGAEAALVALAGHATQTVFRPTAPQGMALRPLLPRLPAPQPPAAARVRLRRLLTGRRDESLVQPLINLLAARGYVTHPADWMPSPRDDWAPAIYAPWLTWAAAERSARQDDHLTLVAYDDWPWAERRAALAELRRHDPAAAREIVAAKAAAEPAERRLRLVEVLEERLEAADAPLLEGLLRDRSDRVQALAKRLLARLGHGSGDAELAAELAQMLEFAKLGLIRRRQVVRLKALKTQAQEKRRRDLMGLVTLRDLATALGVTEAALVEEPAEGETGVVLAFIELVAETGSDAARRSLLEALLAADGPAGLVLPLAARGGADERAALLPQAIGRETVADFTVTRGFAGPLLGTASGQHLFAAPAWRALEALLRDSVRDNDKRPPQAEALLRTGLANLGLLADPAAAQRVIDTAVAAGFSAADPRLDILHLNAALRPERST